MTGLRLGLLAVATFVYVTFEIFPVGLITDIAGDLRVSEGQIGLLVSGYAIAAAIVTIPSVRLAARVSRKNALVISLVALVCAEVLTTVATNYPMMVLSRVIAALTHGVLWSLVAPVAASLVPREKVGMATSVVFFGATGAAIAGSPLSALIGGLVGWRMAALVLAVVTAATAIGLIVTLPQSVPSHSSGQAGAQPTRGIEDLLGERWASLVGIFAFAVIVVFAHFVSYTYFALLIGRVFGGGAAVAVYLSVFGVAGAVATFLVGRYSDRSPARTTVAAVALFAVGTGGILLSDARLPRAAAYLVVTLAVVMWGAAYAAIGPNYQAGVMRAAGEKEDFASSVYVTCYQVGIASGSAIGALVVGYSLGWLPAISFIAAVVALVGTVRFRRIYC